MQDNEHFAEVCALPTDFLQRLDIYPQVGDVLPVQFGGLNDGDWSPVHSANIDCKILAIQERNHTTYLIQRVDNSECIGTAIANMIDNAEYGQLICTDAKTYGSGGNFAWSGLTTFEQAKRSLGF